MENRLYDLLVIILDLISAEQIVAKDSFSITD